MTAVIVQLCPVSYAEFEILWSQALVWCPRCAVHHDREFLRPRDDTPCPACGHRRSAHGRHRGRSYTCSLSICGCRQPNPKEKPMPETKIDHRAEAERYLASADEWMDADWGWKGSLSYAERLQSRHNDLLAANTHALLADPPVSVVRIDAP